MYIPFTSLIIKSWQYSKYIKMYIFLDENKINLSATLPHVSWSMFKSSFLSSDLCNTPV